MPLVIDTYNDYFFYLEYRRRTVPATVKTNKLALSYFSLMYGYMETEKLLPVHMVRFRQFLQERKRLQRNDKGEYVYLSEYSVYKILVKVKAYIKWLESERKLGDLKPIDVPIGNVPCPLPKYLTKDELKTILAYLDQHVEDTDICGSDYQRYYAYLYRAIIWFLYTSGVRNAELRKLRMQDINLDTLVGAIL